MGSISILNLIKVKREQKLPDILSVQEVRDALAQVTHFTITPFLPRFRPADFSSQRMMVHVHWGKGAKDRYVPLPVSTLTLLREYWTIHKNSLLLFPALGRGGNKGKISKKSMSKSSVQAVFRKELFAAGIIKRRVTVHTLRHSYVTHLLVAGVNIRIIQQNMGHANLEITMAYLNFTRTGLENAFGLFTPSWRD